MPNRVEPGWVHEAIAGVGLKAVQALAEKNGLTLNVGDIKVEDLTPSGAMADGDGPQPLDVASRIVAHIGHRIPGVKKIEKRLEGQDKRSGILSDIGALLAQLYARNADQINEVAAVGLSNTLKGVVGKPSGDVPTDEVILDFGVVNPPSVVQE